MSWNIGLQLNDIYAILKNLQATVIPNPFSGNVNANGYAITNMATATYPSNTGQAATTAYVTTALANLPNLLSSANAWLNTNSFYTVNTRTLSTVLTFPLKTSGTSATVGTSDNAGFFLSGDFASLFPIGSQFTITGVANSAFNQTWTVDSYPSGNAYIMTTSRQGVPLFTTSTGGTITSATAGSATLGSITMPSTSPDVTTSITNDAGIGGSKIQAYQTSAPSTKKNVYINPDGGNTVIGGVSDNGKKLYVNGSAQVGSDFRATDITATNTLYSLNNAVIGYVTGSHSGVYMGNESAYGTNPYVQGVNNTFGASDLAIQPAGGNVGVGVVVPRSKLDVWGTIYSGGAYQQYRAYMKSYVVPGTVGGAEFGMYNGTTDLPSLYLTDSSQVAIGTTSTAGHKFYVNGGTSFFNASLYCSGEVIARSTGTYGYSTLHSGSNSNSGYIEMYKANGARDCYIGFGGAQYIYFAVEQALNLSFQTSGVSRFEMSANGDIYSFTNNTYKPAGGLWVAGSDQRVKENVIDADVDRCCEIIKALPLRRFTYKDDFYPDSVSDRSQLGWIAQDVKKELPKAVSIRPLTKERKVITTREEKDPETGEMKTIEETSTVNDVLIEDFHYLDATQLHTITYGAVSKLIAENEKKDQQITSLTERLTALEALVQTLLPK